MFQLDDDFLVKAGLGRMPEDQRQDFLMYLYDQLEIRVGNRLAQGMSDHLLKEFEKLVEKNDEQGATEWLERNRPNYKQVVAEEIEKLQKEVSANKDRILGLE